jgi:ribonuclease VapC
MIVADTSALMAVIAREDKEIECTRALVEASIVALSAGTLVELAIVAHSRGLGDTMRRFLDVYDFEVAPVTATSAMIASDAFRAWGKGVHPAGLNFGDCFAYALSKERDWPLLFVGDDFSRTDLRSVLGD